jgi:uncharacterized delta-60 repeat protein
MNEWFIRGSAATLRRSVRAAVACALAAPLFGAFVVAGGATSYASRGGEPDAGFGTGGLVTTDLTSDSDSACCVALQSDGRIVVAGWKGSSGASAGKGFVARYLANGVLDSTFGGGVVTPNFSAGDDLVQGLAIQADGKIVVAGSTISPETNIALARYNPDGSFDTSFGSGGKVITGFTPSSRERALAVVTAGDGKIVVSGAARGPGLPAGNFVVARYNPDGALDSTFGAGGKSITDFGGLGEAHGLAIDGSGKIVVVGGTFSVSSAGAFWGKAFLAARYNTDGSPDSSFSGGKVSTDFGSSATAAVANAVAVQRDGKIVSIGWADSRGAVVRYNVDGALDSSFADGGKLVLPKPSPGSSLAGVAIDSHSRIVAAGVAAGQSPGLLLVRLKPNGELDAGFGDSGVVVTNFSGQSVDEANAIALQADAKLVLAGDSNDNVALARFLPTYCVVPNVRRRPLAAARTTIANAHCRVGRVTRAGSRAVRAGRVVSQTPRPGTRAPENAAVALVVSRGR